MIDLYDYVLRFPIDNFEVPFVKDHLIKKKGSDHGNKGGLDYELTSNIPHQHSLSPQSQDKERKIKILQDMGGTRQQAERILEKVGWNLEIAGSLYFEGK